MIPLHALIWNQFPNIAFRHEFSITNFKVQTVGILCLTNKAVFFLKKEFKRQIMSPTEGDCFLRDIVFMDLVGELDPI